MAMREIYAKCTAFDYSYKFFYEDGYGKEFLILNLPDDKDEENLALYFTACLLSFYQQMRLWETQRAALTDFNIEKPLWVFVGNKVSDDDSDILTVVRFLADFLNHGTRTLTWIADLVADRAQIVDERTKKNIFEKRFLPLMGESADAIFTDILLRLFNAHGAQRLKLVNVKNSKGRAGAPRRRCRALRPDQHRRRLRFFHLGGRTTRWGLRPGGRQLWRRALRHHQCQG
jgi:hypothetical protein